MVAPGRGARDNYGLVYQFEVVRRELGVCWVRFGTCLAMLANGLSEIAKLIAEAVKQQDRLADLKRHNRRPGGRDRRRRATGAPRKRALSAARQ